MDSHKQIAVKDVYKRQTSDCSNPPSLPINIAILFGFLSAKDLMLQYEKRGIRRDLLDVILDKKLKLILKAETANEVKRASEPPKPVYNYGTWREDTFSVPEEELAMWAIISPNNMLSQPAQERYMDLFTRVFGITREQLTKGPLPDVKLEVQ